MIAAYDKLSPPLQRTLDGLTATHDVSGPLIRAIEGGHSINSIDEVPTKAISMGCGTILDSKQIALLAWGEKKASVIQRALQGPVTSDCPASFLQDHPHATVYLDQAAASQLR